MCVRQTRMFIELCRAIREVGADCRSQGASDAYAGALVLRGGTLCRKIRRLTRGARLLLHGSPDGKARSYVQTDHIFANQSKLISNSDFLKQARATGLELGIPWHRPRLHPF